MDVAEVVAELFKEVRVLLLAVVGMRAEKECVEPLTPLWMAALAVCKAETELPAASADLDSVAWAETSTSTSTGDPDVETVGAAEVDPTTSNEVESA